jgi:predicted hydrocarbon binding protein
VDWTDDLQMKRNILQETMNFMAALAHGMEQTVGLGAHAMARVGGMKLGMQFAAKARKTADPAEALEEVRRILHENHCAWDFTVLEPKGEAKKMLKVEPGETDIFLVFRDCMIRQSLFYFGHQQKGSLCRMMYGFFSGAIESIMGRKAELEVLHAGPNACLKRLRIK